WTYRVRGINKSTIVGQYSNTIAAARLITYNGTAPAVLSLTGVAVHYGDLTIQNNPGLLVINAFQLHHIVPDGISRTNGSLVAGGNTLLTSLNMAALVRAFGNITLTSHAVPTLTFTALQRAGTISFASTTMTTASFPALGLIGGDFIANASVALTFLT